MKRFIDVRMRNKGGIGTYISQLVRRLEMKPLKLRAPIYSFKEQIAYPFAIPKCDLFFSPHFNVPFFPIRAKKRVVTIHDVYHLDHPDQFSSLKHTCAKKLYARAASSDLVLTVSEFSKGRILHHFPSALLEVIPLGGDHLLGIEPVEVLGISSPFYLFVGSLKPHKNRRLLDGLPLIEALGQYSDGELVWLYKNAEALIFPSFYEGFGLPPLEAMSLGCPVLASHSASIPEVCGEAAIYFDPKIRESLDRALQELPSVRDQLIEKGIQRSSERTWDLCAKRHDRIFTSL